jgi:hypothetical protein
MIERMKKNNSEFLKEKEKGKRPENPAGTNPSDKSARKNLWFFSCGKPRWVRGFG